MNKIVGNFGQVFLNKGKRFVYLVQIGETLYTALIIKKGQGDELNKSHDRLAAKGGKIAEKASASSAYRLVLLTTEDFLDEWAFLFQPDLPVGDVDINLNIVGYLNIDDKKELKKEIENGTYADQLKKEITAIEITE